MKSNTFNDFIKPVLVLVIICVIASFLLAATNGVTEPIIEKAKIAQAEATRKELLPKATSFSQIACDTANVESVYKDDGGSGFVVTSYANGYGGRLTVTVGFNPDGSIISIKVDASGETATVGGKAALPEYTDLYKGATQSADGIDTISGATISSKAVKKAVNAAFEAFDAAKEA